MWVLVRLIVGSLAVYAATCVQEDLVGPSGTISKYYESTYPNNLDDTWNIHVGRGKRIFLNFTAFDLESSFDEDMGGPCVYDYLEVKEGDEVVKRYCGNQDLHPMDAPHPSSYIESCDNSLSLRFVSDFSNVDPLPKGFTAFYKELGSTCPHQKAPEHGNVEGKFPYEAGTTLNFSCNAGYVLEGSKTLICTRGGRWSHDAPRCVGSDCDELKAPEHGRLTVTEGGGPPYKVGTTLQFSCDDGFRIVGKEQITCQKGRKWSSTPPLCHETICERNEKNVERGRKCRKPCEDDEECGSRKFCLCDGVCGKSCFNPEAECETELIDPAHGRAVVTSRRYGDIMKYECEGGYTLNGYRWRKCRSDRKWSGTAPKCLSYETCGQAGDLGGDPFSGRVVYGEDALPGAWPWQALILKMVRQEFGRVNYKDRVHGGGSIINKKWILSAAHVFNNSGTITRKEDILVFLGATKLPILDGSFFPEHVHIHEVKKLHLISGFDNVNLDNDVALMRVGYRLRKRGSSYVREPMSDSIKYTEYIRPVCLPCVRNEGFEFDQKDCKRWEEILNQHTRKMKNTGIVTGFGKFINPQGEFVIPENMQQGSITVKETIKCVEYVATERQTTPGYQHIKYTSRMMCAASSDESTGTDSCSGDSGGPFVREFERNNIRSYYQIGIVSWGVGCGYMGFYTRVTSVMRWVAEQIRQEG